MVPLWCCKMHRLEPHSLSSIQTSAAARTSVSDRSFLRTVEVRLNLKGGSGFDSFDVPVTDEKGNILWFTDEQDSTNEGAVYPLLPSQEKFDYKAVSTGMFVTDDICVKANVSKGDKVFFVGLLPQFYGVSRNCPVVRIGTLALITDEKIPLKGH